MSLLYWNLKSGLLKEGYFGWNQLTSIHVEIAVKHHILCDSLYFYFSTNSWLFSNLQPWFDVSIVKAPVVFVMLEHDNNNFEAQEDLCALKTPHLSSFIPLTIEKTILWGGIIKWRALIEWYTMFYLCTKISEWLKKTKFFRFFPWKWKSSFQNRLNHIRNGKNIKLSFRGIS